MRLTEQEDVAVGGLSTPVGWLSVAVTAAGLARVGWCARHQMLARCGLPEVADAERVAPVLAQLAEYFRGTRTRFDVPLDWRFTDGPAREVLQTLVRGVGYGSCVSYGDLAAASGTGLPARGIGAVMGANPLPIVVPCHRVVAHNGLGGYSGGSGRDGPRVKRFLLTLEGVLPPALDVALEGASGQRRGARQT